MSGLQVGDTITRVIGSYNLFLNGDRVYCPITVNEGDVLEFKNEWPSLSPYGSFVFEFTREASDAEREEGD